MDKKNDQLKSEQESMMIFSRESQTEMLMIGNCKRHLINEFKK